MSLEAKVYLTKMQNIPTESSSKIPGHCLLMDITNVACSSISPLGHATLVLLSFADAAIFFCCENLIFCMKLIALTNLLLFLAFKGNQSRVLAIEAHHQWQGAHYLLGHGLLFIK
jgi:hypothetical protein